VRSFSKKAGGHCSLQGYIAVSSTGGGGERNTFIFALVRRLLTVWHTLRSQNELSKDEKQWRGFIADENRKCTDIICTLYTPVAAAFHI
jgi:hypothetical protein